MWSPHVNLSSSSSSYASGWGAPGRPEKGLLPAARLLTERNVAGGASLQDAGGHLPAVHAELGCRSTRGDRRGGGRGMRKESTTLGQRGALPTMAAMRGRRRGARRDVVAWVDEVRAAGCLGTGEGGEHDEMQWH